MEIHQFTNLNHKLENIILRIYLSYLFFNFQFFDLFTKTILFIQQNHQLFIKNIVKNLLNPQLFNL